jgi:DNA adenine methylase
MSVKFQKPFLKWVGGKTQLLTKLIELFPKKCTNYRDICVGGGSTLFAFLTLVKEQHIQLYEKVYAYDINPILIQVYKDIQSHSDDVFDRLKMYFDVYDSLKGTTVTRTPNSEKEALTSKESYYYWLRKKFNSIDTNTIEKSALFIFLNKTCFRGMYREGPNGFNVPYGHYKKTPSYPSKQEFKHVSNMIKDVIFECYGFETSLNTIKDGDFVYIDPPYAPESSTSFVGYVKDGFTIDKHKLLFNSIREITYEKKNVNVIMSNAKVDIVTDVFEKDEKFAIHDVKARRAINAKNPGSVTTEVFVQSLP